MENADSASITLESVVARYRTASAEVPPASIAFKYATTLQRLQSLIPQSGEHLSHSRRNESDI